MEDAKEEKKSKSKKIIRKGSIKLFLLPKKASDVCSSSDNDDYDVHTCV